MILGMNLLALVIAGSASIIMVLEQRQAVLQMHESAARQTASVVIRQIDAVEGGLAVEAARPDTLDDLLAAFPALESVSRVTTDGDEVAHVPLDDVRAAARDWTAYPAWIAAAAGERYRGLLESADGTPQMVLAIPVEQRDEVLIAVVDPQRLWGSSVAVGLGDKGYVYLVSASGRLLAVDPALNRDTLGDPAGFESFERARGGDPAARFYDGLQGDWVAGRAERIPGTEILVVTETPLSEFSPLVVRGLALWLMALVLTFIVGELLIRRILRGVLKPVSVLQHSAQAVGTGDYGVRARMPDNTDRELNELAGAFNDMTARLQRSQEQINAYTSEVESIVDLRARELSRKALQLEVAAEVSGKIASILDPRALINEVVGLLKMRFEIYHADILRVDHESGMVISGTLRGEGGAYNSVALRDHALSVVAWVARHGETRYVPDVSEEPRYRRLPETPASRCELAIPLKVGGRVVGVLNLEADHRDAFARDEIAVLESLANEIAVSMHNAEMFAALETANRDLAQTTLQAKQASVLKSRFMLNASHKLRTPLNAIIGYSETILSGIYGDMPDTALDRQRRILENGRHLQALIEDMLDLASIESGYVELALEWIEVQPLLEEVMSASRALAQTGYSEHDITLRLDAPDMLPPLYADLTRLRYILINLMSNAVKFTQVGEVVIRAEMDHDTDMLHLHVADTGMGIEQEELTHLFKPFQHQRGSTGVEGKGTGLGLPVSRMLALMHGGDLTVDSLPGRGSTFTLSLPLYPDGAPPPPEV